MLKCYGHPIVAKSSGITLKNDALFIPFLPFSVTTFWSIFRLACDTIIWRDGIKQYYWREEEKAAGAVFPLSFLVWLTKCHCAGVPAIFGCDRKLALYNAVCSWIKADFLFSKPISGTYQYLANKMSNCSLSIYVILLLSDQIGLSMQYVTT